MSIYCLRDDLCQLEVEVSALRERHELNRMLFLDIRTKEQIRKHKLYITMNMFFCS